MRVLAYFALSCRKKGVKRQFNTLLLVTLVMFFLSAIFWCASVANLVLRIHAYFLHPSFALLRNLNIYTSLMNAIILVNVRALRLDMPEC